MLWLFVKVSCPCGCLCNHLRICKIFYIESQHTDRTPFQFYIVKKLHANNQQGSAIATFHIILLACLRHMIAWWMRGKTVDWWWCSCANRYQVLCICYKCCQHPRLFGAMAVPWHWPTISNMIKWEKTDHSSSWNFAWACIYSSRMFMPLCPKLMNMLVTSHIHTSYRR